MLSSICMSVVHFDRSWRIDADVLTPAITLGEEWLGRNSAILQCLRLGIALHHGALPTAYRKEVERLLQAGVLKVTISSPTLAQGLNLSATALVMHSLHRDGNRIEVAEFKNVAGRAGRAYVDMEGIVLYPMFDGISEEAAAIGTSLISDEGAREMESGLVRLVDDIACANALPHWRQLGRSSSSMY